MSYFAKHVFFCNNQRPNLEACCANCNANTLQTYAKERIKALGKHGAGAIRINKAGCLDRCEQGPVMVIYPEAVWYTYLDEHDIDEIIEEHLMNNRVVERLQLP